MKINYKVEHRNVKYPRLEFKGLTLYVILTYEIKDATQLLEKRKAWIEKKWNVIQEAIKEANMLQDFMILGEPYTIEETNIQKPIIDLSQRKIQANLKNKKHKEIIKQQLKNLLKQKLKNIIREYSQKTGLQLNKIIIKQQKTKWGSCSNKKNMSLNLKIVFLPERIIRYIVYHEMLHLKYKKHNFIFWEEIRKEFPDYKQIERKLLTYWFYTEMLFRKISNSNNIKKNIRIYYAHPKWLYNTIEEEQGLQTIKNFFKKDIEIINPKEYDENPLYKEMKKREGMNFCYKLIDKCDCVVFQRFIFPKGFKKFVINHILHIDKENLREQLKNIIKKRKVITPGIAKEVNYALEKGKKVYEIIGKRLKEVKNKLREDISFENNQYFIFNRLLQIYRVNLVSKNILVFKP